MGLSICCISHDLNLHLLLLNLFSPYSQDFVSIVTHPLHSLCPDALLVNVVIVVVLYHV